MGIKQNKNDTKDQELNFVSNLTLVFDYDRLQTQQLMAHIRRSKIWRWRFQWTLITTVAILIAVYNNFFSPWPQQAPPTSCPTASTPYVRNEVTCEPCDIVLNTVVDDPMSHLDLHLGRWDYSRSFKLFDYVVVGENYVELSESRKVCLATQTSLERLHELSNTAENWSGPISVAIFAAGEELQLIRGFILWLARCEPYIYAKLAIHIVTPAAKPGILDNPPKWKNCDVRPLPASYRKLATTKWRTHFPYPQNHLRNMARKNCQTSYVFMVDIDIVPSKGMAESLEKFYSNAPTCKLCAYVVPTYELDVRVKTFPANKSELVRLAKKKLAIPFHKDVFIYNQFASNFSKWEESGGNESTDTHVSHNVTNFELLYEPFYVTVDTVPQHDERFMGYGFTRNTQELVPPTDTNSSKMIKDVSPNLMEKEGRL